MATNNAINTPQITLGGTYTMSGAYTFTGTLTNTTSVTFPTSGTLATTAQVLTPVDQTSSSVTMSVNTLYVTDNGATLVTYTLPTTSAIGTIVKVIGKSSGGWKIAQASGQQILIGIDSSTSGTGGYIASSQTTDCVELVCTTANDTWTVSNMVGNITYN